MSTESEEMVFRIEHVGCGGEVDFKLIQEAVRKENPDFEVCRNEWHEMYGKRCSKECPDYEACSVGEYVSVPTIFIELKCLKCGKKKRMEVLW